MRKRRQKLTMAAAAVVVAAAIGGVWNLASGESPVASTASDSSGQSQASVPDKSTEGMVPPKAAVSCPPDHPILQAAGPTPYRLGRGWT